MKPLPRVAVSFFGLIVDLFKVVKIRIYREDVYKIISEGEGIKTPPINMSKINFKD
ncbi:hypothetical protein ACQ1Q5_05785 [Ornithobacterium rhinotracheale]